MRQISFAQFLDLVENIDLSEKGIEIIVCNLENARSTVINITAARKLKEAGNVVLGIGILPYSFVGEKKIVSSLEMAQCFQQAVDGCIFLNKEKFVIENGVNPEEVESIVEFSISDIASGLIDILKPGSPNIKASTLQEALKDCGTYKVSRGRGKNRDRLKMAFCEAFGSVDHDIGMNSARKLIIKVLVSNNKPLSEEEEVELWQLCSGLPGNIRIEAGITTLPMEENEIEVVMLGTGLDVKN